MFGIMPRKKDYVAGEYPLSRMRQEFDSLFDRFFGHWPFELQLGHERFWEVGIEESDKEFLVRAEAPGFEAEDFDLSVRGCELCIKAERKDEAAAREKDEAYAVKQLRKYERFVTLPGGADTEKIKARYHSGILEVHVPKTEEAKARKITVAK